MPARPSRYWSPARQAAALACAALALAATAAGCSQASTSRASGGSSSSHTGPCPTSPAAPPPAHTLTFPQSIGDYQKDDGPSPDTNLSFIGQKACNLPMQYADYTDSQGDYVTIEAGHHAGLWRTFSAFWGVFFAAGGEKVTFVPAGPLGGQIGCGTDSMGTICAWFDNDTYGNYLGAASQSPSQVASDTLLFRNAIEHTS